MLLEEMASIFVTPYLLIFVVPKVKLCLTFINLHYNIICNLLNIYICIFYRDTACWWHFAIYFKIHCVCSWSWWCLQVSRCTAVCYFFIKGYSACSWTLDFLLPTCSFSSFDFQSHGNRKYASPSNAERDKSSQGKMEKSFLRYVFLRLWLVIYMSFPRTYHVGQN